MIKLTSLLPELALTNEPDITGMQDDSRHVQTGDVFLALPGYQVDGRQFMSQAIAQGASAVLYHTDRQQVTWQGDVPIIGLPNLTARAGEIASQFYGEPSQHMNVIGITGTNGKTSICHFIHQALHQYHSAAGLIGTLGYGMGHPLQPIHLTTPSALTIQTMIHNLYQNNARYLAMEVSSHGLAQHRVDGIDFDIAVFSNLTHDHLDFHGTMEAYGQAKQRLFQWPNLDHAVINMDDPFAEQLLSHLPNHTQAWTYSRFNQTATVTASHYQAHTNGLTLAINVNRQTLNLELPLVGSFNVSNVLAVAATLCSLDIDEQSVQQIMMHLQPVVGRMEPFISPGQPLVVVDYAHTPDALQQALQTLKQHQQGRLITVFGCGGNRDHDKRPVMGQIAEALSDQVILTDDNPRHESPSGIIQAITQGLQRPQQCLIEHDRARAVQQAIGQADRQDIVFIAGKGHETYQIRGDDKLHYSDRQQIKRIFHVTE